MMTTWRKLLNEAIRADGGAGLLVACTLSQAEFDAEFDDGHGCANGASFTAWTRDRVYFPAKYDGAEWVASVPRNPCDEKTDHVGCG